MIVRRFQGFRGTTLEKAVLAKTYSKFDISTGEDEYFGHGIYFFKDDYDEAYSFARKIRKIPKGDIGIISAIIETLESKIMDLVRRKTYPDYLLALQELDNQMARYGKQRRKKHPFDCRIINMICDEEEYLLVRGPYDPKNKKSLNYRERGYTRIPRVHIQLCVRDASIIKEVASITVE